LENAVNYSYDESTVTVTGSVSNEPANGTEAELPTEAGMVVADGAAAAPVSHPAAATQAHGTGLGAAGTFSPGPARSGDPVDPDPSGQVPRVESERDVVRISVGDQGMGIPGRDLERIFERFYRVDHARGRNTGGTGLGLSIVRHVATNHHGRVDVESREGEGSTFTLVLPLQRERAG
jgi:signal transduction histidine kinase